MENTNSDTPGNRHNEIQIENPGFVVEGLIKSGLITRNEADQFGSSRTLESIGEQALLEETLRRVKAAGQSDLTRPITSEDIDAALEEDPDYSKLSDQDA